MKDVNEAYVGAKRKPKRNAVRKPSTRRAVNAKTPRMQRDSMIRCVCSRGGRLEGKDEVDGRRKGNGSRTEEEGVKK